MSKNAAPAVKIVQKPEPAEQIPAEVIASAIVELAQGMRKLNETRLKRDAIVTLIARSSNVARSTIEIVLNNLEDLERAWLKPAPAAAARKGA